jgi:hypothetical protein
MGPTGEKGDKGDQGEVGPTGQIGPTGAISQTFINVYSSTLQNVGVGTPVIYDGFINQSGSVGHIPFTSQVQVWQPGYYFISTMIHVVEPVQFALFLNGALYGLPFSSSTGSAILCHDMIMYIGPNDIITPSPLSPTGFAATVETVNHISFNPNALLNNPAGSAPNDITCNFTLFLLA